LPATAKADHQEQDMNIILLGAPGSGKGTQAKALMEGLGLRHVSSGDLFRENIRGGTELGREAQTYMNRGALVPDAVTIGMIRDRLSLGDTAEGVLFDGFPRTVAQADALDGMLAEIGKSISAAILLDVSEEELVERLTGRRICRECQTPFHIRFRPFQSCPEDRCEGEFLIQRPDDSPETVAERLAVYGRQTSPLIEHFRAQGKLIVVPGEGEMDDVTARMAAAIAGIDPG
jgi:adenylate kinase